MTLLRTPIRPHRVLLLAGVLLAVAVIPHAAIVFVREIPATFVVVHAVAASTCFIVGEQRRQWRHRVDQVLKVAAEITAAHR
ncbi:hypothetical protein [Amycolatopsis speibonae]|uniref:Uncharacterized protein n=1 Tax=Amycolatopsis speibonae TaxID=1450224 RepID=A0ABV7P802_9PSEU